MDFTVHTSQPPQRFALLWIALSVSLSFVTSTAYADDVAKLRQQLQDYTLRLADLEKADTDKTAIQDIKLAQSWLNEAQVELSREEETRATLQLRKVSVAIDLISTILTRAQAEKEAQTRETQAKESESAADEAGLKLEEARARKKELQTAKP